MNTKNVLIICSAIVAIFLIIGIASYQTAKEGFHISMDNNTAISIEHLSSIYPSMNEEINQLKVNLTLCRMDAVNE